MSRDISQGIDPSMQFLSSAFNSNSTDGTLSRMLGEPVKGKPMFCAECGTRLEMAYRAPNSSDSEIYCKQHWEELFGSKCEGCNQSITGQFVNVNGKKYHQQCHSQDIPCGGCNQRLFGESVEACGKSWHTKCFKCTLCYTPLDKDFVNRKGFPYCKRCNEEPPAHAMSSLSIKADSEKKKQETQQKNQANQQLYSNIQKGKVFCAECGQMIAGTTISFGESLFHEDCFCCSKCGKPVAQSGFKTVDGAAVCPTCTGGSNSGGGFCAGCGQKLVGQFISAMGQKWHKNCFVCSSCQQPFAGGYAEKNGMPYCSNCIQKGPQSVGQTVTIPGTQKVGFTVDPRTGKKKFTT